MASNLAAAPASLDVGTLFFIAICVTSLLGLFLLYAWSQERIRALAWWSVAYLIGGASGALWRFGDVIAPRLPSSTSTILLFIAVGMIWSAARVFHGRPVRWIATSFGSVFWLVASFVPAFAGSAPSRFVASALIVACYTFLTALELRRERRKSLRRRWPAIFVPTLHGAIFLFPVALATLSPGGDGIHSVARGWIAVFAIEILLYVVGTAFIVLILAKDRTVHIYKTAATTDPLTGLLNRRGFFEAGRRAHDAPSPHPGAGQRARLRSRSLQIGQRPVWARGRRRGPANVRKSGAGDAPCERRGRPPGRRGIRCSPPEHVGGSFHRRGTRARGARRGELGPQRPAGGCDGQHRGVIRLADDGGGFAHYPR